MSVNLRYLGIHRARPSRCFSAPVSCDTGPVHSRVDQNGSRSPLISARFSRLVSYLTHNLSTTITRHRFELENAAIPFSTQPRVLPFARPAAREGGPSSKKLLSTSGPSML